MEQNLHFIATRIIGQVGEIVLDDFRKICLLQENISNYWYLIARDRKKLEDLKDYLSHKMNFILQGLTSDILERFHIIAKIGLFLLKLNDKKSMTFITARELNKEERTKIDQKVLNLNLFPIYEVEQSLLDGVVIVSQSKMLDASLLTKIKRVIYNEQIGN